MMHCRQGTVQLDSGQLDSRQLDSEHLPSGQMKQIQKCNNQHLWTLAYVETNKII